MQSTVDVMLPPHAEECLCKVAHVQSTFDVRLPTCRALLMEDCPHAEHYLCKTAHMQSTVDVRLPTLRALLMKGYPHAERLCR